MMDIQLLHSLSKQIGMLKGKGEDTTAVMAEVGGLGDALKANETAPTEVQANLAAFMESAPNLPHASVPAGTTQPRQGTRRRTPTAPSPSRRRA